MREIKFRAWDKLNLKMRGNEEALRLMYNNSSSCDLLHSEVEIMQYTGLKDKNGVEWYEDDVLLFDFVEDGFDRSKAGEIMKEKGATQLLIHIKPSECMETSIEIYFLKGGIKLTENDWFGYEVEFGSKSYSQKEDGAIRFLKYLSSKNLRCIGNIYQNPELLTD